MAFARLLCLGMVMFVCLPALAADKATPPNFVVILADDLGYGDLGCYGQKRIKTPNLDQMAEQGMRFTDFYVASSLCSPSRAAFLTGSYAQRVGLGVCSRERDGEIIPWHVLYPRSLQGLNPNEITIAEQLKNQGYATACVGKWHVGDAPEHLPTRQGFDYYYGIPYSNDMKPTVLMRNEEVVKKADQTKILEQYTREAVKYIAENKDKPFFLYLAHNAPHTPIHPSDRFNGKSAGGAYGDVVEELDWSTGEVLKTLKDLDLDERTMVVFFSDNGPWLLRGENGGRATPLRNGKGSSYEGGFRVPCIAWWPGTVPEGAICTELVTAMDLFPTLSRLAGAALPRERKLDGKDVSSLLIEEAGARTPHKAFFFYFMDDLQAVRSGKWKLKLETTAARDDHYTHVGDPLTTVPAALYDLTNDPGEQKSVLKDHPEIVERLQALAEQARVDLGDARLGATGRNRRPAGYVESAPDRGAGQ